MSALENIKIHAEEISKKTDRGESLSKDELKVLQIYNSLHSKKAGNAGKRKITKTGK